MLVMIKKGSRIRVVSKETHAFGSVVAKPELFYPPSEQSIIKSRKT